MYIAFEGIVWSGKTTQVKKLVQYLGSLWKRTLHVREPWWTPIAEDIRTLAQVKSWDNEHMHPLTNAYLYAAARSQVLHTLIKPALGAGEIVISDRCFLSSCAYQWEAQWLWIERVLEINKYAIDGITPDIIFYMDIDVDIALSRTFDSSGDKWEHLWKSFFLDVILGYEKCEMLDIVKDKFIRLDTHGTENDVFERVLKYITI